MKYLLCVGVIAGFGYIGLCVRSHLSKKVKFYEQLIAFLNKFIINVNFLQINFIDYLNEEITKNNELAKILIHFKQNYIDNISAENIKHLYLSDSELKMVFECLNSVGGTDSENQIALLNGYKVKFEQLLKDNNELMKKYSGLAVKMSIIVGCLIVLIFI